MKKHLPDCKSKQVTSEDSAIRDRVLIVLLLQPILFEPNGFLARTQAGREMGSSWILEAAFLIVCTLFFVQTFKKSVHSSPFQISEAIYLLVLLLILVAHVTPIIMQTGSLFVE